MTKEELIDKLVEHGGGTCGAKRVVDALFRDGRTREDVEDFLDHIYELKIEVQSSLMKAACKLDRNLVATRPVARWCRRHMRVMVELAS
jgi:hypothetical protein